VQYLEKESSSRPERTVEKSGAMAGKEVGKLAEGEAEKDPAKLPTKESEHH
jgi:hypothetical protein